jgi:hypothetical protein
MTGGGTDGGRGGGGVVYAAQGGIVQLAEAEAAPTGMVFGGVVSCRGGAF